MASFYIVYLAILNFFSAIWKTICRSTSSLSQHLHLVAPAPELPTVSPNTSPVASTIQAFGTNDAMNHDEIEEFYKVFGTPRSSKILRSGQRIARTPPEPFSIYTPHVGQPAPSPQPDLHLKAITGGLNIHSHSNIPSSANDTLSTSPETRYSSDLTTSEFLPSSFTSVQLSEASSATLCSVDVESTLTKCADDFPREIFKNSAMVNTKARRHGFFGGPLVNKNTHEDLKSLLPSMGESIGGDNEETTPDISAKALDIQEPQGQTAETHPLQRRSGPSAEQKRIPHPLSSPASNDLDSIEEIATLASIGHFMTSNAPPIPSLEADISVSSMSFEDELETIRMDIEGTPFNNFGDLGNSRDPTLFLSMLPHNKPSRLVPVLQKDVLEPRVLDLSDCVDHPTASAAKANISVCPPSACSVDESRISLPTTLRAAHSAATNSSHALDTPVSAYPADSMAYSSTLVTQESVTHPDTSYAPLGLDSALDFPHPRPNRLQQKRNRSFTMAHFDRMPYMHEPKSTNGVRTATAFSPGRCSTPPTDLPGAPELPGLTCNLGSPIVVSSFLLTKNNATFNDEESLPFPLEPSSDISPNNHESIPEPVRVDAFEQTLEYSCMMAPLSTGNVARMGIEDSLPRSHSSVGSDSSTSRYTASSSRSERDRFFGGQISASNPGLRTLLLPFRLGLYDGPSHLSENSADSPGEVELSSRFSVDSLSDDGTPGSPNSPTPSWPEGDNDSTMVALDTPEYEYSLQREKLDALFDALQLDTLVSEDKSEWLSSFDTSDGLDAYNDSEEYEVDYYFAS